MTTQYLTRERYDALVILDRPAEDVRVGDRIPLGRDRQPQVKTIAALGERVAEYRIEEGMTATRRCWVEGRVATFTDGSRYFINDGSHVPVVL